MIFKTASRFLISAVIFSTFIAAPGAAFEVAVKGKTKKIKVEVSKDTAEIQRIKEICEANNKWSIEQTNPKYRAKMRVESIYSSIPVHRRLEGRAGLEAFANTKEGPEKDRSLQQLRIAYGEEAAFSEFIESIDTAMDLNHRDNKDTVNQIFSCFRLAKPSWLNSERATAKINAMFEHPNRYSIEKLIFLLSKNNLHQYVPQVIDYHKKYLPDDKGQRTINKLKAMNSSQAAFDYVKSIQKNHRIDHIKAFGTSCAPEIRKEAREHSKLPPLKNMHEVRRVVRPASDRILTQDSALTPEQLKLLVDQGWPESTTMDDLNSYGRLHETANAYGRELAAILNAAKIGVQGDFSQLNYVSGDEFEFYYLVEANPEKEAEDVVSFVVNDTLYRFLSPQSGFKNLQAVIDHPSPDWHVLDELEKQKLVNSLLEKHGVKRRIVFLGNPKFKHKNPTGMILCAEPAKLAELKETFSLLYYEGK